METLAIALLAAIIILGGAIIMIFLQFLSVSRETRGMHREIMESMGRLQRKVDDLAGKTASSAARSGSGSGTDDNGDEDED